MTVRMLSLMVLLLSTALAHAHDVRPGYLEITEARDSTITILWKQTSATANTATLTPKFSSHWTDARPEVQQQTGEALIETWRVSPPHAALHGTSLRVDGLETTITDVLVRVIYADGTELTRLLRPSALELIIPDATKVGAPVREYLQLGFVHIWTGIDHLLYVLGLVLLVKNLRVLLKTITGFTVAHSISLAAAALGYVHIPPAPVEAVIALSIVYVAVELMRAQQGHDGLAQRAPWVVAMSFGLLHGLGFAGALSEVGLPPHAIPQALLLFNIGIEIGQLTFVALILLVGYAVRRLIPIVGSRLQWVPPYAIGSSATFWVAERIHFFLR
jgi:hypothetical protein